MNKIFISGIIIGVFFPMIVLAETGKKIPAWMETVETNGGNDIYLVPVGAKRKLIGSQVIVESTNEYVARRLYEIEEMIQERFDQITQREDKLKKDIEELTVTFKKLQEKVESLAKEGNQFQLDPEQDR